MGAGTSALAMHARIDAVLPHHTFELAKTSREHDELLRNVKPVFPGGYQDRAQFVQSLSILLSSNGELPLSDKKFKLVYTQAPDEGGDDEGAQVFVSILAISPNGMLAAKVVSDRAGRDRLEAFQLFRKTVEMHMHKIIETVPGPGQAAGPSSSGLPDAGRNLSAATLASTVLPDEPPAYQEAGK